nr:DUF2332 family protein [Oricola sp.]
MSARTLPPHVVDAFRRQERACLELGSPFTAMLCGLIGESGLPAGPVRDRLSAWRDAPGFLSDALPLRLVGALHYLVLSSHDDGLARIYPPQTADEATIATAIDEAVERHGDLIGRYLDSPPQTNETGRSAVLLPAFLYLQSRFDMPLVLSELGASAGLNQNWPRFRYEYGPWTWGSLDSPVTLACEWLGETVPAHPPAKVADCAGCDIAPIPIATEDDRLRLQSYVWADQPTRLMRLAGALSMAVNHPPNVAKAKAGDWLDERLRDERAGHLHIVFHTIMWQYLSSEEQAHAQWLIESAGRRATAAAPLAWLRFEPDGQPKSAALTVTIWNGEHPNGETIALGRGDYHGRWIEWTAAS